MIEATATVGGNIPSSPSAPPGSAAAARFTDALEAFLKLAYQTPAERARDAVLERHSLDEASYAALPPQERARIDAEIADAVRRVTERDTGLPQDDAAAFVSTLRQLGKL